MRLSRRTKIWIAGILAGLSFALALLHLIALTSGGAVILGPARLATVSAGLDRKAEQLLGERRPPTAAILQSERLTQLALDEFPYDTSAWLRLAYIDRLRLGHLSATGIAALSRSYDLVAVDPQFAAWRIHFALENWENLPLSLKNSVRTEAAALSSDGSGRGKLAAALRAVEDPIGSVIATLWLDRYVTQPSQTEQRALEKAASRVRLLNN